MCDENVIGVLCAQKHVPCKNSKALCQHCKINCAGHVFVKCGLIPQGVPNDKNSIGGCLKGVCPITPNALVAF